MLSVANKPFLLSVVMLDVIVLSVFMLNVVASARVFVPGKLYQPVLTNTLA